MIMSKSRRRPARSPQEPPPKRREKASVRVVFVSTMNAETGGQISRNIIGMFEDQEEAAKLERKFNEQEQKAEGVITSAYSIRYNLPYIAPAMKDLVG